MDETKEMHLKVITCFKPVATLYMDEKAKVKSEYLSLVHYNIITMDEYYKPGSGGRPIRDKKNAEAEV